MKWLTGSVIFTILFCLSIEAQTDVCTISSVAVPLKTRKQNIEKLRPNELAKIDISGVTEGSQISRSLRIPGTSLYTYVEVFFDDDLKFYDNLHDAITVWILVLRNRQRTDGNTISKVRTQIAFDEHFKQSSVTTAVKYGGKRVAVEVMCRGKKVVDE